MSVERAYSNIRYTGAHRLGRSLGLAHAHTQRNSSVKKEWGGGSVSLCVTACRVQEYVVKYVERKRPPRYLA